MTRRQAAPPRLHGYNDEHLDESVGPAFSLREIFRQLAIISGGAYPHPIPLARLKCVTEKRVRDLAGRLLKSPGGQRPGLQSAAVPTLYFTLVREMKSAYHHRLRLVAHARQHGIKPDRWFVSDHRPHSARVAAPFSAAGACAASSSFPRSSSPARQDSRRHRTGRRFAPAVVHFQRSTFSGYLRNPTGRDAGGQAASKRA